MEGQRKVRFGNYDLVSRIDVGGMGEVYLARQRTAFDREVAIKIIREDLVHDITARERFLREAEVSAHLKHEHILPLFEFGEEQGRLFFVTPYIEGGNLARRLQNGPLPLPEVRQLFSALVDAVAYIHRRGVVHRDLKPSNILLDQGSEGQVYVRLIDFGIARSQGTAASPPLTVAGHEMGTVAYMAPERLSGVAAPSNDIYSLGVILYQMLTGHLPTPDQHIFLPQPLDYVVRRCMARHIDQRFTSAEEVRNAFEQACQQLSATRTLPPAAGLGALSFAAQAGMGDAPYGREKHTVGADLKREVATLQRTEDVPSSSSTFSPEDYDAPTTTVGASQIASRGHTEQVPVSRAPHHSGGRQRRSPWVAIFGGLTVAVLLTMAGIVIFGLQLFSTVSIHFSPQTQLVSQIFQLKAEPFQKHVDPGTQSIPARALSSRKTGSQTGPTTGEACIIFTCHQIVSASDVDTLSAQVKQTLIARITQDLQRQAQAAGATAVGSVQFADLAETANPPVGSISKTVTVTLTEQGSLEYFVNSDAKTLARQLLLKQMQTFGTHYRVVSHPGIQIGRPVVAGVSDRGVVRINIAAGGYIEYQFPGSQLLYMQNHVKGMTVKNARIFIASQVGVDPKTVSIGFTSSGKNTAPKDTDTLPAGTQQIKIIPADPAAVSAALPPVQLPRVTPNSTTSTHTTSTGTPMVDVTLSFPVIPPDTPTPGQ
jgi:serine/threonine protein kinase